MILIGQYDSPSCAASPWRSSITASRTSTARGRPWPTRTIATLQPAPAGPALVLGRWRGARRERGHPRPPRRPGGPERALLAALAARRAAPALRVCALATGLADKAVSLLYEHVLRTGDRAARWVERCTAQIGEMLDLLERSRAARRGAFWFGERSQPRRHRGRLRAALPRRGAPGLVDARGGPALAAHAGRCEALPVFREISSGLLAADGLKAGTGPPRRPRTG